MNALIRLVVVALVSSLSLALTLWISSVAMERQSAAAARRRTARRRGEHVSYPVRLRGPSSSYPSFWRAGRLSEVPAVKRILTTSRDVPAPPPARVPLRWVRNRVPLIAAVVIMLGFFAMAAQGYAMVSATPVRATISENRGGDYLCGATSTDASGRFVEGWVSCADEYPGDQVDAYVLGWPRTGTLTDRQRDADIMGIPALVVALALFMTEMLNLHSRRIQALPSRR